MRELLVGLVLSLAAASASAQWVLVSEGESGDQYYADPTTKRRTANIVRIWELKNNVKPDVIGGKVYYSYRIYNQYDCSERTRQALQLTFFAGKMASGETASSGSEPLKKVFIEPRTTGERLLNFACR